MNSCGKMATDSSHIEKVHKIYIDSGDFIRRLSIRGMLGTHGRYTDLCELVLLWEENGEDKASA